MFVLWFMTALALSLDGLAAGFSLGLRKIRLSSGAKILIALISAAFAAAAIGAGSLLRGLLSPTWGSTIGGWVLILLGLSGILHALHPGSTAAPKPSRKTWKFHLLGLTILVLHDPIQGDLDASGVIDLKEAVILGASLSMDMLGAGLGLALGGAANWWGLPLMVAAVQTGFLSFGSLLGRYTAHLSIRNQWCEIAAGGVLLMLGFARLFL